MDTRKGKLWGTVYNDAIEIRSLVVDELEKALDVLNDSFFINEAVCIGSEINLPQNIQARKELREMCRIIAQDCVSLIAIEKSTDTIVAVAFNKLQYISKNGEPPFFIKFRNEHTHTPHAKALLDFMSDVDAECDVFTQFNLSCVCELTFLATLPSWERRGIASTLTKYTIELTRHLSKGVGVEHLPLELQTKRPQAVSAIFTSHISQKIGKSLGFQVLSTVPYTRFHFNGKAFNERINKQNAFCEQVIYLV